MRVTAKVRRVGNSLSVVMPVEKAKALKLAEGDIVILEIRRKVNIQDLFGSLKSRKTSQMVKNEARSGWGE